MEHIIKFERGYDCIRFECVHGGKDCIPGKGGSHGVSGLVIRFVSKDIDGAVQFVLGTGWLPQRAEKDNIGYRRVESWGAGHVMPYDLGYHSKKPRYDDQKPIVESCEFCDGEPCYHDRFGLNANDAMYALVNGGEVSLWNFLDAYYHCVFHDGPYPCPAEYPVKPRVGGAKTAAEK